MSLDFANPYARFTPRPGVSAEDFSFQNSFDSLLGQTESLSVAGLTGSIDTIGKYGYDDERNEKKDKDGISWDDVAEAHARLVKDREAIIASVGGIDFSQNDFDAAQAIRTDPNLKQNLRDRLIAQGMDPQKADHYVHMYLRTAEIAEKRANDQPLTSEDLRFEQNLQNSPEDQQAIENVRSTANELYLSSGMDISADTFSNNAPQVSQIAAETYVSQLGSIQYTSTPQILPEPASTNETVSSIESNSVDGEFDEAQLAALTGGGVATSDAVSEITSQGPVISAAFNTPASGANELSGTAALQFQDNEFSQTFSGVAPA